MRLRQDISWSDLSWAIGEREIMVKNPYIPRHRTTQAEINRREAAIRRQRRGPPKSPKPPKSTSWVSKPPKYKPARVWMSTRIGRYRVGRSFSIWSALLLLLFGRRR